MGKNANGNDIVFELKTRATSVLRYDIFNYIDYLDYEIVKNTKAGHNPMRENFMT